MLCNLRRSFRLFFVLMPLVYYVCVNSEWGQWSLWSSCTVTCGYNGSKNRFRTCINSSPPNGGLPCPGDTDGDNVEQQTLTCPLYSCPVDGGWGQWLQWSVCTKTCGGNGNRYKQRYCNNPSPANGGKFCEGVIPGTNYQFSYDYTCAGQGCPVDGGWGQWLQWSVCTKTCGGNGYRYKQRYCNNPSPANGGKVCEGVNPGTNYQFSYDYTCAGQGCPVDGQWTNWSTWSHCSATCDGGNKTRERNCSNPLDENGGRNCNGSEIDNDVCSIQFCPAAVTSDAVTKEAAIGGAVGAVVVVLIIVGIVVMLLRKRKILTAGLRKRSSTNVHVRQAGINVSTTVLDNNQDDAYLKLERVTGMRSVGNDYDELQVHNEVNGDPDNAYCEIALGDSSEYDKR